MLMKKISLKALLSTLLMVVLLILIFTGALLYFGKTGVIWGISRGVLRKFHFFTAVSMCVLVTVHLSLNCRLFLSELRALRKRGGS